jgi:SAM-dependent methyltransferase
MSADYRWNQSELAAAYDADAPVVHPFYAAVQDALLELAADRLTSGGLVVDLGGGSGRLIERFLDRFPNCRAILVDQSAPFLDLASRRLARFVPRFECIQARLQDDWRSRLPAPATVIVSTSAIHHLEPAEKQALYRQVRLALAPGGLFANGDEVRPADDDQYLKLCCQWGLYMQTLIDGGKVSEPMAGALRTWQDRNITRAQEPRKSGDDCHETAATQLDYLKHAGFTSASTGWSEGLWTVLIGTV